MELTETIKNNWQMIKEAVRDEYDITSVSYSTWIEPLEFNAVTDNKIQIVFPSGSNDFALRYITKKYSLFFQVVIEEMTGLHYDIEFIQEFNNTKNRIFVEKTEVETDQNIMLDNRYTFDNFVVGANNKFAHAASLSVAESPGQEYNPLFIYGGPGLGKTHLMKAIAHFILTNNPRLKVIYVSSEVFINEIIESMMNHRTELKNKYRNADVLLIDDIQSIIGKEKTEEEFFNTFNFLHEKRKQIVLSSDQPPKNFTALNERLRSRFEWGLSVDISSPDYETRMAILRKKVEFDHRSMDNEILQYIATNIKSNIRELEGALTKMYAYSDLTPNDPLTLDVAKNILKDVFNPEKEKIITADHILEVVAEHYNIRVEDIKSQKRTKEIVRPRHIAMYLVRLMMDISLDDVGKLLGNRDHSTVIYGYDNVVNDLSNDEELKNTLEILKKKIIS